VLYTVLDSLESILFDSFVLNLFSYTVGNFKVISLL
jgi:hypothetical protein